jgi:hypothetical protein
MSSAPSSGRNSSTLVDAVAFSDSAAASTSSSLPSTLPSSYATSSPPTSAILASAFTSSGSDPSFGTNLTKLPLSSTVLHSETSIIPPYTNSSQTSFAGRASFARSNVSSTMKMSVITVPTSSDAGTLDDGAPPNPIACASISYALHAPTGVGDVPTISTYCIPVAQGVTSSSTNQPAAATSQMNTSTTNLVLAIPSAASSFAASTSSSSSTLNEPDQSSSSFLVAIIPFPSTLNSSSGSQETWSAATSGSLDNSPSLPTQAQETSATSSPTAVNITNPSSVTTPQIRKRKLRI